MQKTTVHKLPGQAKNSRLAEAAMFGVLAAFLVITPASAQEVGGLLQNAYDFLISTWGRGLALLAIAWVGFRCLSGRMDIGQAITVLVGIVIIVGGPNIYEAATKGMA